MGMGKEENAGASVGHSEPGGLEPCERRRPGSSRGLGICHVLLG